MSGRNFTKVLKLTCVDWKSHNRGVFLCVPDSATVTELTQEEAYEVIKATPEALHTISISEMVYSSIDSPLIIKVTQLKKK